MQSEAKKVSFTDGASTLAEARLVGAMLAFTTAGHQEYSLCTKLVKVQLKLIWTKFFLIWCVLRASVFFNYLRFQKWSLIWWRVIDFAGCYACRLMVFSWYHWTNGYIFSISITCMHAIGLFRSKYDMPSFLNFLFSE